MMRKFRVRAMLAILFAAAQPLVAGEKLSVMCWNIEWFPGGRPNAAEEEVAAQMKGASDKLKEVAPQILFAQELTDQSAFEKLVKVVPKMKVDVFSRFLERDSDKPSQQQVGIASTLEADSAWFESFEMREDLPSLQRGFAFAALKHPDGGLVMCYSVHLKSNRGSDKPGGERNIANTRKEAVRQLLAHKAAMEKRFAERKIVGWIIAGDMNTNHDGQFPMCTVVADLIAGGFHNTWEGVPKSERATWRNKPDELRFKPTTFDYIMTSRMKKARAKLVAGVPVELSDHAPMVVELMPE